MTIDYAKARETMVEQQVRPWDVFQPRILDTIARLPRERFVAEQHRALAYADVALPIGHGESMMKPVLEGRTLQALSLDAGEDVLEIGTGSGYTAALMASLAQHVLSLEIEPALASQARTRLMQAGITNVEVRQADACANDFAACRAGGPYDAILLAGSVAEVPPALLGLLAPGGRLAVITGSEPMMRATFITRAGDADFRSAQPWDTVAPRLRHFPEPSRFRF